MARIEAEHARNQKLLAEFAGPPSSPSPTELPTTPSDIKAARDKAIREIAARHPEWREKDAHIDFPSVCRALDEAKVPALDSWYGDGTWTGALGEYRDKVKQYIRKQVK
jgi:hypothetical protein